jgi:hypothetical protein
MDKGDYVESSCDKLSCVIQDVPFEHHHRFQTKTTPLDVGKLFCLTSLVIFFVIFSDNYL